jgi:uncharacterized protein (DUF488 family)
MAVFYTIGYGGRHPQRDFLARLQQHHITLVCDVRMEPRKAYRGVYTFNPEKGTGPLVRLLAQAGIAYRWFPELGNPDRQDPDVRAFRHLMAQQGATLLQPLRACLTAESACLLCAEQDVQRCHRRIIAEYLEADGFTAIHLV